MIVAVLPTVDCMQSRMLLPVLTNRFMEPIQWVQIIHLLLSLILIMACPEVWDLPIMHLKNYLSKRIFQEDFVRRIFPKSLQTEYIPEPIFTRSAIRDLNPNSVCRKI